MSELFDLDAWRQLFSEAADKLGSAVMHFVPRLLASVVLVGLGWLIARTVEAGCSRIARRLGVDRLPLSGVLDQGGAAVAPASLIGRISFWVVMLAFVGWSLRLLDVPSVTAVLDRLVGYVPSVLAATVVLGLGVLLAHLSRNLVASAAAAARMTHAGRLGSAARSLVVFVAGMLAIEQLGVDTRILVTVTTIVVGALAITFGLAFALGARPVVTHVLAGHFLRQSLEAGMSVDVAGCTGVVERVRPVDTLIRSGDKSFSIPNAQLLDEVVAR